MRSPLQYWMGKYPEEYYYTIRDHAYGAGIYDLDKFLKNVLRVSLIITILLAATSFVLITTQGWSLIVTLTHVTHFKLGILRRSFFEEYKLIFAGTVVVFFVLLHPVLFKALSSLIINAKRSARAEKLDHNLYILVITLLGSAQSGLSQIECIAESMRSNLSKEVHEELSKIYYAVKFEGKNLRTALIEVATTTPSKNFSALLRELAGIVESTPNFLQYLKNKLTTMEITETLNTDAYLSKISGLAQTYVVFMSMIGLGFAISGIIQYMTKATVSLPYLTLLSGVAIVSSTALFSILMAQNAPEKYTRKPYTNLAIAGATIVLFMLYLSIFLKYIANVDFRLQILAITSAISTVLAVFFVRVISKDSRYDNELFLLLNKLSGLLESKTLSKSLLSIRSDEFTVFRKDLENIWIEIHTGTPLHKALDKLKDKAPTFISHYTFSILSRASQYTHNLTPLVLHLISDFHNYTKFITSRKKVTRQATTFLMISVVLIVILFYFITGTFNLLTTVMTGQTQVGTYHFGITQEFICDYKDFSLSTCMIIASVVPLIICSIEYDIRKFFLHYSVYSVIVLVIAVLMSMGIYIHGII